MWTYEKRLMYPINIKNKNPRLAKSIITQYGGYAGELGAALRYLTMRYTMPTDEGKALLTEIGTEELAHIEMINTIVLQLTNGVPVKELKELGVKCIFGSHPDDLVDETIDYIIKNPGINNNHKFVVKALEFNIPVIMEDERLTSVISNNILISANISRNKRKKKVDGMAAELILQGYLDKVRK